MPPKPKVNIMNNRNKKDHVRTLMQGVDNSKAASGGGEAADQAAAKKPTSSASAYRSTYVFDEEAKAMVDGCD